MQKRNLKKLSGEMIESMFLLYESGTPKLQIAKKFKHLNTKEIQKILNLYLKENKNHNEIVKILKEEDDIDIDRSTVYYHIKKSSGCHRAKKELRPCHHTALKCLVCGRAQDYITREELELIYNLKKRVNELEVVCGIKNDII